jgi:hypothetical protein
MELIDNIETYAKIIVGLIGGIVTFGKLRESFASIKRKQELKIDLEILEILKNKEGFETAKIENKIKSNMNKAFEKDTDNLTNFFVGIAVFIGFGFWSIDIFKNSETFNGWIILTLMCSLIGLALIFGNNDKSKDSGLFYQIGFYDKGNFQIGFIITLLTAILTPILIWRSDGLSFWQFLSGLFFFIGLGSLIKNTKRIK